VDGARATGPTRVAPGSVVRAGGSALLVVADVGPFERRGVIADGAHVVGPAQAEALDAIRLAAAAGRNVLVEGETGAGKEHAARAYHAATGRARGPFVAENVATLPPSLAEARLFGARKGAFTGAHEDVPGLFQLADGGTLFLDELGELDPALQAKLLRVLEDRRIRPLGAAREQPVDVRVVADRDGAEGLLSDAGPPNREQRLAARP
jgi:transcriptional regulator with GAF, ATPase, and Fis domain